MRMRADAALGIMHVYAGICVCWSGDPQLPPKVFMCMRD